MSQPEPLPEEELEDSKLSDKERFTFQGWMCAVIGLAALGSAILKYRSLSELVILVGFPLVFVLIVRFSPEKLRKRVYIGIICTFMSLAIIHWLVPTLPIIRSLDDQVGVMLASTLFLCGSVVVLQDAKKL
jgi:hypothetical protein